MLCLCLVLCLVEWRGVALCYVVLCCCVMLCCVVLVFLRVVLLCFSCDVLECVVLSRYVLFFLFGVLVLCGVLFVLLMC